MDIELFIPRMDWLQRGVEKGGGQKEETEYLSPFRIGSSGRQEYFVWTKLPGY